MENTIHHTDCLIGLRNIGDETVDIIIADPPYNIGKDFGNNVMKSDINDYVNWCKEWINECVRILKPTGTLYIYGFSESLSYIRTVIDINVRWLVWHYTNKTSPKLNFWQRSHESILCCYKEKPVFNKDDVREEYTSSFKSLDGKTRKSTKGRYSDGTKTSLYKPHEKGALPRDVIKIPSLSGRACSKEKVNHPSQKPLELCRKLLLASKNTDKETLLVVPFAGSGSECVMAKKLNINYIGFEINKDYIDICNERLRTE